MARKSNKQKWTKAENGRGTIWHMKDPSDPKLTWVVGEVEGQWVAGIYSEKTSAMAIFAEKPFKSASAAKAFIEKDLAKSRAANKEVTDVVLAAEQYYAAQQDQLDAMKHGTPAQLARAREKTKKTKEVLEDMTGANRELYGAMAGGALGGGLAGLTKNPFAAAIGALTGSLIGSLVARPRLHAEPPSREDSDERGGDVIAFPRRVTPRRGYAANKARR